MLAVNDTAHLAIEPRETFLGEWATMPRRQGKCGYALYEFGVTKLELQHGVSIVVLSRLSNVFLVTILVHDKPRKVIPGLCHEGDAYAVTGSGEGVVSATGAGAGAASAATGTVTFALALRTVALALREAAATERRT